MAAKAAFAGRKLGELFPDVCKPEEAGREIAINFTPAVQNARGGGGAAAARWARPRGGAMGGGRGGGAMGGGGGRHHHARARRAAAQPVALGVRRLDAAGHAAARPDGAGPPLRPP